MKIERSVSISVLGALTCSMSPTSLRGYTGTSYSFTISWSNAVPPVWITITWGDGTTDATSDSRSSGSVTRTKTWNQAGSYSISVNVSDYSAAVCKTSGSATIADPLGATFDASPKSGRAPLEVTFSGSVTGGHDPITWTISFGDGGSTSGSGRTISAKRTYTSAGTYNAVCTISDALGYLIGVVDDKPIIVKSSIPTTPIIRTRLL